jgi:hypothetical protein
VDEKAKQKIHARPKTMKAALALLLAPTASAAVVSLQAYNVDLNSSSVSGLSSGAFFAVQVIDSCAYAYVCLQFLFKHLEHICLC